MGQPEHDGKNGTPRKGLQEQDRQDMTSKTVQAKQDSQRGQAERDRQKRTGRAR
jgi:hypothetical protein